MTDAVAKSQEAAKQQFEDAIGALTKAAEFSPLPPVRIAGHLIGTALDAKTGFTILNSNSSIEQLKEAAGLVGAAGGAAIGAILVDGAAALYSRGAEGLKPWVVAGGAFLGSEWAKRSITNIESIPNYIRINGQWHVENRARNVTDLPDNSPYLPVVNADVIKQIV